MQDAVVSAELDKPSRYREIAAQIDAVGSEIDDEVALMATAACLVHNAIPYASWTGFYRVIGEGLLRVGPYQGPLGCLEIEFGKGVCGTVAETRESLVVPDVDAFPGHIACDEAARSEVVVPVFRTAGGLFAVLDVDSRLPAAFDDDDRAGLEAVAEVLKRRL
ncbi:MAG: GAF domain-containing protein [Thermoanaerobaculia bacterium]